MRIVCIALRLKLVSSPFPMRRILVFLALLVFSLGSPGKVRAQSSDPSDLFLNAYMAVQQGEGLEQSGRAAPALAKYRYAATLLDQIGQKYPNWQPLIVEYRKKRTSESIARLEQQVGNQPPEASGNGGAVVEPDVPMPQKEQSTASLPTEPLPQRTDDAASDIKGRIDQLQNDLRDSRQQLQTVQQQKEKMAAQLGEALKQLVQNRTSVAELKAKLQQLQQALQNNAPGNSADSDAMKKQIAQLQNQLEDAQADREAADTVNSDYARRLSKVRKTVTSVQQERQDAANKLKDLEAKYANASKVTQELADAKAQISKLTQENQFTHAASEEVSKKLADAQKQLAVLGKERDAARKESDDLNKKVSEAQAQIASVSAERDSIAKQRDQALADLAKARDAQKKVDQLMADNATLSRKLGEAEKTIHDFNASAPEKDQQIAALRKEVTDTKDLLASAQKQSAGYQASMANLQKQLDGAKAELVAMQTSGASSEEKKKYTEENELLRGIVVRQLKEQARREQAKKLVLSELQGLQVRSGTLLQEIDYLGQPVVKLTDKEKALFKQPQIEIADTDSAAMEFSVAAPKPEASGNSAKPHASPTSTAASPNSDLASANPSPSAVTQQSGADSGDKTAAGAGNPPQVETSTNPNVPDDLLGAARDAKDQFDRGQYRDAEKTYEQMLTKAPNNVYILSNLGVVDFRQNKMKLAEEKFKKAIAVAPGDSFSHRTLGIVYYQEGKYDQAVTALTAAVAITPKDAIAHNYLGITASQKGWQEAALKELQTAIALDPNYADANFNLAVIYATMQPPNKEMASKYYKRAVGLGAEADTALEQLIK